MTLATELNQGKFKGAARAVAAEAIGRATAPGSSRQIEAFDRKETGQESVHSVARDQLKAFIHRIERLEEEKKTIADDIKDVYGEAKGTGFDAKILRKVISLRKQDTDERMEQEAILDTYLAALGMIPAAAEEE
ncbi:unknown [Sinorhizobium phage PBC5]|uniref:DUF2312 domain-containing protein n=1 Tax=Sinorhizobium phage PBC5 TaxID=179237 RepID=UPI000009BC22|nr:DUF2312 domain-containing protein [Sinorhizobium phage PBC5]AAL49609.1 unknown [Sinorhizobium phage PBC5]